MVTFLPVVTFKSRSGPKCGSQGPYLFVTQLSMMAESSPRMDERLLVQSMQCD